MTVWASLLKCLVVLCQTIILFMVPTLDLCAISPYKNLSKNLIATSCVVVFKILNCATKLCHHVVPLAEDPLESQSLFPTKDIGDTKTVTCFVQKVKYQPAV